MHSQFTSGSYINIYLRTYMYMLFAFSFTFICLDLITHLRKSLRLLHCLWSCQFDLANNISHATRNLQHFLAQFICRDCLALHLLSFFNFLLLLFGFPKGLNNLMARRNRNRRCALRKKVEERKKKLKKYAPTYICTCM